MGDTERKNRDEAEMVEKLRARGYIVTKAETLSTGYQRDTSAMIELEIQRREDGGRVWINVDGICWLRIMPSPACTVRLEGFENAKT